MSIRAGPSRLLTTLHRAQISRSISTSLAVPYPRLTSNRFAAPPRPVDIDDADPEIEDGAETYSPSSPRSIAAAKDLSAPSTSSSPTPSPSSRPGPAFPERTFEEPDYDPLSALAAAKQNAWYLDDAPTSRATSSSTTPSSSTSQGAPSRQPIFTTFDPDRTTSSAPKRKIKPLPDNCPPALRPLHEWMTSKEAAYVLDPSSVRFMCTRDAGMGMTGEGEMIKVEGEVGVGAVWEWIVVGVVRGKGKGIVGRAERALRLWLSKNPLTPQMEMTKRKKLPRVPEETDWSIVQIPSLGTSINLFTWEGRERWNLEGMWRAVDKEPKVGFGFVQDSAVYVKPDPDEEVERREREGRGEVQQ